MHGKDEQTLQEFRRKTWREETNFGNTDSDGRI